MKELTPYTDQSNTLDTLGIAYQRLRSCNKTAAHTDVESELLRSIKEKLSEGMASRDFNEVLDTIGKLYQRVSSVNSNTTLREEGCPSLYQRVIVLMEDLIINTIQEYLKSNEQSIRELQEQEKGIRSLHK